MEMRDLIPHETKFSFCLLIILFIFPEITPQELPFGHLSVENGLSNNAVNCILQDHLGFLWFGTEDGLNRYDGYEIKIYRYNPHDTNSLSDNSIWSLFEDSSEFLWIGTNSGVLNRYDFKTDKFVHWKIESKSSKQNRITSIYQDNSGLLWIGTYKEGLYRFNLTTNQLEHWQYQLKDPNSISHNYITSIVEDIPGNLWISTYNGLNRFNPKSPDKAFTRFFSNPNNPNSLSNNLIWILTKSKIDTNILWISTADGLTKYNTFTNSFSRIEPNNNNNLQFENSLGSIIEETIDNEKILWIATYGGLLQINLSTGKQARFINKNRNTREIASNHINYCIKDSSNVLWLATDNGLSFLSPKSIKFNYLYTSWGGKKEIAKIKDKNITAITESSDRNLWIGTQNGLYSIDNYAPFNSRFNLEDLNVWSLAPGNSNDLWIGTYGQGIKQLDLKTGNLKSWNIKDTLFKIKNFTYKFVKSILQDRNGMLWIGFWGTGLTILNPQTGKYKNWQYKENDSLSLSYNDVWTIFEDSKGRIWIGTNGGGLNLFADIDKGKFYCWSKGKSPFSSLSTNTGASKITLPGLNDNNIYSICEAKRGKWAGNKNETVLWIGTGAGLNQFILKNSTNISHRIILDRENYKAEVHYFTVNDGLPDNAVKSILEDEDGNLWLGTNLGISFFNVEAKTFTNYTTSDGLNGNEFNYSSAFKLSNKIMMFGSSSGLNIFEPKKIKQSDYSPPILITGFQIFNRQVPINKESPLKKNITLTKEIFLTYNQNVFSFQFSSLDYNSPQSNQYIYKMEGFDKDWIYSGSRQFVTYTNLDPGSYIFKVKATNSDGIWSKNEASLRVIINPPWWKSVWAYCIYVFIIFAGFFAIRRFQINRAELRHELQMREFETKKLQELENLKSRFFANLSHEFRTPLMLIKGPVEELINSQSKQKSERKDHVLKLKMIQRNSQKLQELIDQLLELSQLEAASIPLKAKQENLTNLVKGIFYSFESFAKQKDINLELNLSEEILYAWIDRDKFEKIISNLLSNAFKFTKAGGTVSMVLCKFKQQAEIKIIDTGIGISEDHLQKIFIRFYQVDDSSRRAFSGSGIGLSLVKELVDLHKWKISVKSELEKGTEFILSIPLGDEYLKETEKVYEKMPEQETITSQDVPFEDKELRIDYTKPITSEDIGNELNKKLLILIVEDSFDVRIYLTDILKSCYKIIQAENGEAGLKMTMEKMPDLIISDIMMPHMDGIEFCHRIKTNWETSHIPVILLTAKASSESKIEGLETGADDYLTKPFDSKELFIRVKNLIEQRRRLKEKFNREIKITADAVTATSLDNEFLNKAFKISEKNLANADFDLEIFAKEMFVSRSQLHRKLIAITGLPPGEFLRSFRLKRAAQMLLEKRLSVTQIAFEVGFKSPSHFTKAFRQQFKCLPSEFIVKE